MKGCNDAWKGTLIARMPTEMQDLLMFKNILAETDVMDALSATAVIKSQLQELQRLGETSKSQVKSGRMAGFEDTPNMKRLKTDMKKMAKAGHDVAKEAVHIMSKETTQTPDAPEDVDETADTAPKQKESKKKKKKPLKKLKSNPNIYRRCTGDAVSLMKKREIATCLHL